MTSLIIIVSTLVIYSLFWCWHAGFGRKVSPELIGQVMVNCTKAGGAWPSETHQSNVRKLLEKDDGIEFVMVNLPVLKSLKLKSSKYLKQYSDIFLRSLLKRGGPKLVVALILALAAALLHLLLI